MNEASPFKVGDKVRFRNRAQDSTSPMVIKKIDGKDHYLGSEYMSGHDGLKWLAGNLMLDSEWPGNPPPVPLVPPIEKGVPIPHFNPVRPKRETRVKASKWPPFLKSLVYGDSFVLSYPEANTVKTYARALNIRLHWVLTPEKGRNGMAQERFWKV